MHKSATKCNETVGKWSKNKHGASKIIDTFETYQSTAFYVASMVGKPLALDKNYLRNFSYIRVKYGCQDITLVLEKRIGEIRKAFYEFHFTREMPEPAAQPNNQVGVVNENQGGGE
jgi:hypothetical protein